jgi:hypothetical protein
MVPLPGGLLSVGGENGVVTLVIMFTDEMAVNGGVELVEGAVRLAVWSRRSPYKTGSSMPKCSIAAWIQHS